MIILPAVLSKSRPIDIDDNNNGTNIDHEHHNARNIIAVTEEVIKQKKQCNKDPSASRVIAKPLTQTQDDQQITLDALHDAIKQAKSDELTNWKHFNNNQSSPNTLPKKPKLNDQLRIENAVWIKQSDPKLESKQDRKQIERGIIKSEKGNVYTGQIVQGRPHGFGELNFATGAQYKGYWKSGLAHGSGTYRMPNKNKYIGMFENGRFQGVGRMSYKDGSSYNGEWVEGRREGKGVQLYANGDVFEGEWSAGRRDGSGRYKYHGDDKWVDVTVDDDACSVCKINEMNARYEPCGHLFCADCVYRMRETGHGFNCALCRQKIERVTIE